MNEVKIDKGMIIDGVFDKNILGASQQGLIHIINNDYGNDRTKQFLDDTKCNAILKTGLKQGYQCGKRKKKGFNYCHLHNKCI